MRVWLGVPSEDVTGGSLARMMFFRLPVLGCSAVNVFGDGLFDVANIQMWQFFRQISVRLQVVAGALVLPASEGLAHGG